MLCCCTTFTFTQQVSGRAGRRLYSETVRGTAGLSTLSCPVTDGGVRQARVHLPAGRPQEGGEEQIPGVCPGVGGLPPRE